MPGAGVPSGPAHSPSLSVYLQDGSGLLPSSLLSLFKRRPSCQSLVGDPGPEPSRRTRQALSTFWSTQSL